jgi:hypothetical protein
MRSFNPQLCSIELLVIIEELKVINAELVLCVEFICLILIQSIPLAGGVQIDSG